MDTFRSLLRTSAQTVLVEVRPDGGVVAANPAFARYVGLRPDRLVDRVILDFLAEPERERFRSWTEEGTLPDQPVWMNFVTRHGDPFTLRCLVGKSDEGLLRIVGEPELEEERSTAEELMRLNNELATMARERARQQRELERVRSKLEATLEELRTSYWHLQKIQEALPICMECGKVKAGEAQWRSVVDYLKQNEIFVSHGYCPDCGQAKLAEWGLE